MILLSQLTTSFIVRASNQPRTMSQLFLPQSPFQMIRRNLVSRNLFQRTISSLAAGSNVAPRASPARRPILSLNRPPYRTSLPLTSGLFKPPQIIQIPTNQPYSTLSPPKSFAFLQQPELESWLDAHYANAPTHILGRDFIVFDVRDTDQFAGYHINGAVNLPSTVVLNLEDARDAVEMVRLESFRVVNKKNESLPASEAAKQTEEVEWPIALPKNIVFHCNLSLIRGPKTADRFLQGLNELAYRVADADKLVKGDLEVKVWVLEGGSKGWKGRNPGLPYTIVG